MCYGSEEAEVATGFKLGQVVGDGVTGRLGRVVGFGRVNNVNILTGEVDSNAEPALVLIVILGSGDRTQFSNGSYEPLVIRPSSALVAAGNN